MAVYVCNFCGGDHGAAECRELLCEACLRPKPACQCQFDNDLISAGDAIEKMLEDIGMIVPDEDWNELDERYGNDLPIELFAHVAVTYPITGFNSYLKELFPPAEDDGKVYNASRKLGNCYFWSYSALERKTFHSALSEQNYPPVSDEDVYLVQGFTNAVGGGFTGHAWLETGELVIDCGSTERKFTVEEKVTYYVSHNVQFPRKYTMEEAREQMLKHNDYAQWVPPPPDLPLSQDLRRKD